MKHEHLEDEIVEIGIASEETKGGPIGFEDAETTLQVKAGLTDD